MSSISVYLENIINETGGFSKFQWMLVSLMMGSKLAPTWSMLMMTFAGAEPDWYCLYDIHNKTLGKEISVTKTALTNLSGSSYQQCHSPANATAKSCPSIQFDDNMDTVVSEWKLICSSDWISSGITTIQMAGLLVSGFLSGHLADHIGRIPAWSISAAGFGFVSMWLHNWKYLHFATAICTAPWLLFWWLIPESFRFLVTHGRLKEAENVIVRIANINGRPVPDLNKIKFLETENTDFDAEKKYSIKNLFTTPYLFKITIWLGVGWLMCGYGYYAISFGVQSLSGSLHLNMFLLSVVEVPAVIASYFLNNHIGRKKTTLGLLALAGVAGLVVAALQITDLKMKNQLINGFALTAKIGVAAGWLSLMLLSTESFPTVVRNIGYGLHNSMSRIGAMVAPQVVYLNHHVPGIMYFIFGGAMLLSTLCTALVQETNKKPMKDVITKRKNKTPDQDSEEMCSGTAIGHTQHKL